MSTSTESRDGSPVGQATRNNAHEMLKLIDLLGTTPEWQELALCAQTSPDDFYPEKGGSAAEAKKVCGRCEVKSECLAYALSHDERFGIWGGLTERERRKLKRVARR